MNLKHFFLVLCASATLISCLDEQESHYSPQIGTSIFYVYSSDTVYFADTFRVDYHLDSLRIKATADSYLLDTIEVGDTVRFAILYDAISNNLQTARVSWEEEYVDLHITNLNQIRDIMLATSDSAAGVIHLPKEGYHAISFPVEYVATRKGAPMLTLTAESDSKYSSSEIKLKTPIR